jgi:hypothetical protein
VQFLLLIDSRASCFGPLLISAEDGYIIAYFCKLLIQLSRVRRSFIHLGVSCKTCQQQSE